MDNKSEIKNYNMREFSALTNVSVTSLEEWRIRGVLEPIEIS